MVTWRNQFKWKNQLYRKMVKWKKWLSRKNG